MSFARHAALIAALLLAAWPAAAADVGYAVHVDGLAARMVGDHKAEQFGWGGGGFVRPEIAFSRRIGVDLAIGAIGLSAGSTPIPGLEETGAGYSVLALPGLRLRPFGAPDGATFSAGGLWLSAGAGLAYTGKLARGAIDANIGYDLFAGRSLRFGPAVGFLQIIETHSVVLPEDARIVTFGLHGAFEHHSRPRALDDDPDHDGIRGNADRCPNDAEDFDGFQDTDGCPDLDNDDDGILDVKDQCPNAPETYNGFEDRDGCPDADKDRDHDHIPDYRDACPDQPEDRDGFQDSDGCPDDDNDNDQIPDVKDQCPFDPETYNGYADEDGCPDEQDVRVVGDEILVDDRVYFRVNDSEVQVRSWPLIQRVAVLLKANPQYELVRVQGHADDTGAADYNVDLSVRRGNSVRKLLVSYGVAANRLIVEAFGDMAPAEVGENEGARSKNRRVELHILKRKPRAGEELTPTDAAPTDATPKEPKP